LEYLVAEPDSGFIARASGSDINGNYRLFTTIWRFPINPRNPIIMKGIRPQVLKTEHRGGHSCYRAEQQNSTRELVSRLAQFETPGTIKLDETPKLP